MAGSREKFEDMFSEGEEVKSKEGAPEGSTLRQMTESELLEIGKKYGFVDLKGLYDLKPASVIPPSPLASYPVAGSKPKTITEWAELVVAIQKEIKEYRKRVKETNSLKRAAEAELEKLLENKP